MSDTITTMSETEETESRDARIAEDAPERLELIVRDAPARLHHLGVRPRAVERDDGEIVPDEAHLRPEAVDRQLREIGAEEIAEVALEAAVRGVREVDVVVAGDGDHAERRLRQVTRIEA